jgi:hypothetical protein
MLASRAASAVGTAAQTATQAASGAAVAASNRPDLTDQAQTASARINATTQQAADKVNHAVQEVKKPENQEKAADATAKTAWGTLIAMLLGLAAAAIGGHLGGSRHDHHHARADIDTSHRDNR